jgi:hypothetical protein
LQSGLVRKLGNIEQDHECQTTERTIDNFHYAIPLSISRSTLASTLSVAEQEERTTVFRKILEEQAKKPSALGGRYTEPSLQPPLMQGFVQICAALLYTTLLHTAIPVEKIPLNNLELDIVMQKRACPLAESNRRP